MSILEALAGGLAGGVGQALGEAPANSRRKAQAEVDARKEERKARLDAIRDIKDLREASPDDVDYQLRIDVARGSAGDAMVDNLLKQLQQPKVDRERFLAIQRQKVELGKTSAQLKRTQEDISGTQKAKVKLASQIFRDAKIQAGKLSLSLASAFIPDPEETQKALDIQTRIMDQIAERLMKLGQPDPRLGAILETPEISPADTGVIQGPPRPPEQRNIEYIKISQELFQTDTPTDEQLDAIIAEARKRGIL